jgi:Zn-dependent protease
MDEINPAQSPSNWPRIPLASFQQAEQDGYPDNFSKPEVETEQKSNPLSSLISLAIFALAFYYLISPDWYLIISIVIILLIHEAGHLLAMRAYGYKHLRMVFIPLVGAVAIGTKEQVGQKERAVILLAGPIPGILIGLLLLWLNPQIGNYDVGILGWAFIALNTFNLLPVSPLDGGRLIESLFFNKSEIWSAIFTALSAAAMIILIFSIGEAWYLLIFPVFLLAGLMNRRRSFKLKKSLQESEQWPQSSYSEMSDGQYWGFRRAILRFAPERFPGLSADHYDAKKEVPMTRMIRELLSSSITEDLKNSGRAIVMVIWLIFLTLPFLLAFLNLLGEF